MSMTGEGLPDSRQQIKVTTCPNSRVPHKAGTWRSLNSCQDLTIQLSLQNLFSEANCFNQAGYLMAVDLLNILPDGSNMTELLQSH